ncbi:hypothetical protein TWF594_002885 [Orbilia oligospora]|uniref:Uncharacterized protein n=1 Tax=Orbilia oligospora TaxID=2813651 RepID=A0A7C8NRS6_ORBOL|nr:hypothetical protein TWF706_005504 [Orbilia oligospora]KAF3122137.1 hypothetical protein TWF594_002885 [Orbilia oligospora]KAF3132071.1 hypothetical protein TWF703_007472 [Orbilia oligospora]
MPKSSRSRKKRKTGGNSRTRREQNTTDELLLASDHEAEQIVNECIDLLATADENPIELETPQGNEPPIQEGVPSTGGEQELAPSNELESQLTGEPEGIAANEPEGGTIGGPEAEFTIDEPEQGMLVAINPEFIADINEFERGTIDPDRREWEPKTTLGEPESQPFDALQSEFSEYIEPWRLTVNEPEPKPADELEPRAINESKPAAADGSVAQYIHELDPIVDFEIPSEQDRENFQKINITPFDEWESNFVRKQAEQRKEERADGSSRREPDNNSAPADHVDARSLADSSNVPGQQSSPQICAPVPQAPQPPSFFDPPLFSSPPHSSLWEPADFFPPLEPQPLATTLESHPPTEAAPEGISDNDIFSQFGIFPGADGLLAVMGRTDSPKRARGSRSCSPSTAITFSNLETGTGTSEGTTINVVDDPGSRPVTAGSVVPNEPRVPRDNQQSDPDYSPTNRFIITPYRPYRYRPRYVDASTQTDPIISVLDELVPENPWDRLGRLPEGSPRKLAPLLYPLGRGDPTYHLLVHGNSMGYEPREILEPLYSERPPSILEPRIPDPLFRMPYRMQPIVDLKWTQNNTQSVLGRKYNNWAGPGHRLGGRDEPQPQPQPQQGQERIVESHRPTLVPLVELLGQHQAPVQPLECNQNPGHRLGRNHNPEQQPEQNQNQGQKLEYNQNQGQQLRQNQYSEQELSHNQNQGQQLRQNQYPEHVQQLGPHQYPEQWPGYNQYSEQQQGYNQYPEQQPGYNQYPGQQPARHSQYQEQQPGYNQYPGQWLGHNQYPEQQPGHGQYPGEQPGYNQYLGQQLRDSQYPRQLSEYNQYPEQQPGHSQYPGQRPGYNQYPKQQPGYNQYPGQQTGSRNQTPREHRMENIRQVDIKTDQVNNEIIEPFGPSGIPRSRGQVDSNGRPIVNPVGHALQHQVRLQQEVEENVARLERERSGGSGEGEPSERGSPSAQNSRDSARDSIQPTEDSLQRTQDSTQGTSTSVGRWSGVVRKRKRNSPGWEEDDE